MKTKEEICRIHGREAPMSQVGSFLAGYRAAERDMDPPPAPVPSLLLGVLLLGGALIWCLAVVGLWHLFHIP